METRSAIRFRADLSSWYARKILAAQLGERFDEPRPSLKDYCHGD